MQPTKPRLFILLFARLSPVNAFLFAPTILDGASHSARHGLKLPRLSLAMTVTSASTRTVEAVQLSDPSKSGTEQVPENTVSYPGGPTLSFMWSREPLVGQSLYLGGEEGNDGKIYCIPGHSPRVLVIDTKTDEAYLLGPKFEGKFKWLRGVVCGDVIYGLPCHAACVLRIHVPTGSVTTIPIPYHGFYSEEKEAEDQREMTWKYHGGTTCPLDGCIYAIPQSAWHVLKIDPHTETCTFVGPALVGRYKWYGGIVGKTDGAIYGIPHNSPSVLRIDPSNESCVTLHGDYGKGGHKWHGAATAPDGTIVSVPANADSVLCITPARPEPVLTEIGDSSTVKTGRHRSDNKYKYLGAMTGTDRRVYCFPSGAEQVLQIDTVTRQIRAVGPNLYDTQMERLQQNKWQNGLTSVEEQCVYAIPLSAETVLRIDTSQEEPEISTWKLPKPYNGLAKWEGGVLASNGVMYCMPNNHKAVLKLEPPHLAKSVSDDIKEETQQQTKDDRPTNGNSHANQGTTDRKDQNGNEDDGFVYKTGIATLRSSAHRVKAPLNKRKHDPKPRDRDGQETNTTFLPPDICKETTLKFDVSSYDFQTVVAYLLEKCDSEIVGSFAEDEKGQQRRDLEDFRVPSKSLSRSSYGGCCESAQKYLSDAVESDVAFLDLFDRFVTEQVLPDLKSRLLRSGAVQEGTDSIKFYYQRPPTMRLQPGPARSIVKAHNDAEYGHQYGELNFWMPLTSPSRTGVNLWCESAQNVGDYHPLQSDYGEVVSFHGSSCRHYVNANESACTRVSLDFRVGVEGYFDLGWQMHGTSIPHNYQTCLLDGDQVDC